MSKTLLKTLGTFAVIVLVSTQVLAKQITVRGRLQKTVEAGGWIIANDSEKYLLLNAKKFQGERWFKESTEVEAVGETKDVMTTFMQGTPFEARTLEPVTDTQEEKLAGRTITGTVHFIGGARSGRAANAPRSASFTLNITRVTTADEVSQLNAALASGGQDQLLSVLRRMNAGRIRIGTGVGVTANAIMATQEGEQTKLTVLYQREVRIAEARYGTRSRDFQFGFAELYLGPGGNQGMLIYAARIRLRDDGWQVEDFGTFPARLMGLRLRGSPRIAEAR
ncbi:MAG: hypothetical protein ND866_28300 [Pyrinomonadaceae bacterium]|nr:hypothetical protein [Pyrinomonadaceae bacterium]